MSSIVFIAILKILKTYLYHSKINHDEIHLIMIEFRKGIIKTIIATDFPKKGFDFQQVALRINYDFPINSIGNIIIELEEVKDLGKRLFS